MTKDLIQSKKFVAAILASILSLAGLHLGLTVEEVATVTGPLYIFVLGQGIADLGKEKAKIETQQDAS